MAKKACNAIIAPPALSHLYLSGLLQEVTSKRGNLVIYINEGKTPLARLIL